MTAARVVEALDELEHRDPRLGLRLEPTPVEKLAFKRGEEALAHRIVVSVSNRTHRGTHAGLEAAVAELNGGVLCGFKRSSQHSLCQPIEATGQAPLQAFSNQASFEAVS